MVTGLLTCSTVPLYTSCVQPYNWTNQSLCTRNDKIEQLGQDKFVVCYYDIKVNTETNACKRFDEYAKQVELKHWNDKSALATSQFLGLKLLLSDF